MYARKIITTIFILFLWAAQTIAQPIYFDNFYGADTIAGGVGIGGTVKFRSGYYSWSAQKDAGVSHWRLYAFEIDTVGELMAEVYPFTEDTISERAANVLVVEDSLLVGLSYRQVLTEQVPGDMVLTKIRGNGDIIWKEAYGLSDRLEIPQRAALTADGGFILAGQVTIETQSNQEADAWLVKTDSLGNMEWEQTYGGPTYDSGSDIVQTPDGGFLLLGWTRSFGAGQRDFYLVKTDSVGEQEWQRTYGGGGEDVGSGILQLSNGNYLLTGGGTNGAVTTAKGYLFEVTPNGQQVWHEQYESGSSPGDHLFKSIQLSDGSLVSCGLADNDGTGGNAGWLVKTDANGELLWQREYDKNEHTDLFYSVLATYDGGFLLSGQAVNEATNSQDAWLLKVDSVGCEYPNCTVGISEVEKTVMVDVWPNPVSDVLNIEVIDPSTTLEMTVTDMQGRVVLRTPLRGAGGLNVRAWPSGIYILQGMDEKGRSFSIKVVKH